MAPTCPSPPGSLAVRLHVWYCPPSPHLWQANSNPSASHQTPQIDAVHQWAVRQICRKSYPPSDGSNIWSGDSTHIYTCIRDWLCYLVLKNFAIFFSECALFHPGSTYFVFAVSVRVALTRHVHGCFQSSAVTWTSRGHRSIDSAVINPTLHPSISPLSSPHWRARPSLFHRELFNIMRALLPPGTHPSVLHGVWQQLLQTVMVEREAGHQCEMEKEVNLSSTDRTSALISPQKPGASFLDNTQFIF